MKLIDIVNAALLALRRFGPYALLELLMPGGTILAVLLYLYRRRSGEPRASPALRARGFMPMCE